MVLRQVRASDAQERNLYLRRATALDEVRTGIYQSAIAMRAYLLADSTRDAAAQLGEWETSRATTDRLWRIAPAFSMPADAPQLASLRAEVQDYWRLLDFLATIPERDRQVRGSDYLNREVVRRRGATLDLVDRIDQMNARQMAAGDAQLNHTFNTLRLRLILMLAVTVAGGCGAGRLHHPAHACAWRRNWSSATRKAPRTRQELQELSARLVSAQEEERRAISRELHDEVGQSLSALLMEAGNAAAHRASQFGRGAPPRRFHQAPGRGQRQRHPQHDSAAAAVHAGRFRIGAGARMAGARSLQTHRSARAGVRRRYRGRTSRRA